MIAFPNCKINLGLHITRKREDGYHDVETVFYPLPLHDALEVIRQPNNETVQFTSSGLSIAGDPQHNLCVRAWQLLHHDFPQLPPALIHLHKVIPMGAGLGGGSADGAFTLQLLNKLFHLELSEEALLEYALQLGSDCPFFIRNHSCFATGRGEQMSPLPLDLSAYTWMLVHPGIHISTAQAFAGIRPKAASVSLPQLVQQPVEQWKEQLVNDFEAGALELYPALADLKSQLYQAGALYASMTGSGSAFYGIFPPGSNPAPILPAQYKIYTIKAEVG